MSAATRRRLSWRTQRFAARHGLLLAFLLCVAFWTALVLGIWRIAVS